MKNTSRILVCTFFGALLCATLSAILFISGAVIDGSRLDEALLFGLIAGLLAAFFGAIIGFIVSILKLGLLGGSLAGLLATFAAVAFYVMNSGCPGEYTYFLSESLIIVAVLALPAILTGLLAALLQKRLLTR